jgi:hypothetical protein
MGDTPIQGDIMVHSDGTPSGTCVLDSEGRPIQGVTAVEIRVGVGEPVSASMDVDLVRLHFKLKRENVAIESPILDDIMHRISHWVSPLHLEEVRRSIYVWLDRIANPSPEGGETNAASSSRVGAGEVAEAGHADEA